MPLQPIRPVQQVRPKTVQPVRQVKPPAARAVAPKVVASRPAVGTVMSTAGGGPTIQDWIKKVSDWAKAARAQVKALNPNPNNWGARGPGTFQGLPVPKQGPSAYELYMRNVPDWLKPWQPKK